MDAEMSFLKNSLFLKLDALPLAPKKILPKILFET